MPERRDILRLMLVNESASLSVKERVTYIDATAPVNLASSILQYPIDLDDQLEGNAGLEY